MLFYVFFLVLLAAELQREFDDLDLYSMNDEEEEEEGESNNYQQQNATVEELYVFFTTTTLMGLNQKNRVKDY